jgi:hypothetical protein
MYNGNLARLLAHPDPKAAAGRLSEADHPAF